MEGLFAVRCPSTFVGGDNKYFQDFENQAEVKPMGEIISYITPFCGRHSIRNPKYVYQAPEKKLGISLTQYGVVSNTGSQLGFSCSLLYSRCCLVDGILSVSFFIVRCALLILGQLNQFLE